MRFKKLIALGGFLLSSGAAMAMDCESVEAKTDMQAFLQRIDEGWDARDAKAVSALYAKNASFSIVPSLELPDGREPIRALFSDLFTSLPKTLRHRMTLKNAHAFGEWCAVDTTAVLDDVAADGEITSQQHFSAFWLLKHNGKGWEIHLARAAETTAYMPKPKTKAG